MKQHIGLFALIVPDYDVGIAFFVSGLGFDLVEDIDQGHKRWVVVRPKGAETGILIARAEGDTQLGAVGDQFGGRVGLFLYTQDFSRDAARIIAAGGTFEEEARDEPYGRVAVFRDPFGNRWDLLQRAG